MLLGVPTAPQTANSAAPRVCGSFGPAHWHRGSLCPGFSGALAALVVSHASWAAGPVVAAAAETPYTRGFNLQYGLQDGRIRKCDSVAQPNCVSSASISDLYSPPWLASSPDPLRAATDFDDALRALSPDAEQLASEAQPNGIYMRYRIPSAFEFDIVEVLLAKQRPPYEEDPPLVTFRMQAGTLKYVWPIQQPVSDMQAQRKRAAALRQRLGWRINGGQCSSQECFQE